MMNYLPVRVVLCSLQSPQAQAVRVEVAPKLTGWPLDGGDGERPAVEEEGCPALEAEVPAQSYR